MAEAPSGDRSRSRPLRARARRRPRRGRSGRAASPSGSPPRPEHASVYPGDEDEERSCGEALLGLGEASSGSTRSGAGRRAGGKSGTWASNASPPLFRSDGNLRKGRRRRAPAAAGDKRENEEPVGEEGERPGGRGALQYVGLILIFQTDDDRRAEGGRLRRARPPPPSRSARMTAMCRDLVTPPRAEGGLTFWR